MRSSGSIRLPVARGFSLFLGLFSLLNLLGALRNPAFDANEWWIDLAFLPHIAGNSALFAAALALLSFGIGFPDHFAIRRTIQIAAATLAAVTFWNVLTFYALWFIGRIHPAVPVPLSLLLSMMLSFILRASFQPWRLTATWQRALLAASLFAAIILFPLAQMYCFGKTEYRRPADVIVVFGARTYADGTPSQALADRVATAVELYKAHLAPLLLMSGGPGDGPTSEPQAMKRLAVSLGVPEDAILVDEAGLSTEATVDNTFPVIRERHITRLLAVSHFYHLPRVKMTYARALHGLKPPVTVYTVPAHESAPLAQMPFYMLRETAAIYLYYLRPLWTPAPPAHP
jgi:vancomycin permeability regulator SanA